MADAGERKLLDLAFGMDCTGSMGSHIEQARQNIKQIVETIISKEQADVQLALVEYRDHPPQDSTFVTRVLDFTNSVRAMKERLDACSAQGGGDGPEAVADALHALLKLNWREGSTKICVLISDAPPHGLDTSGDGFPAGCPCNLDPMVTARDLVTKGITLYVVGCEPSIVPYRDWFMALAHLTGGQYVPLIHAHLLPQVIIGGAQEEISLQRLMEEVNVNVMQELGAAADGSVDQMEVESRVYKKMAEKGHKSKHLRSAGGSLPAVSENAKRLTDVANMKDAKEMYSKMSHDTASTTQADFGGGGGSGGVRSYTTRSSLAASYLPAAESRSAAESDVAPALTDYHVDESEISPSQISRMVQKSVYMNQMQSKVAKKKP